MTPEVVMDLFAEALYLTVLMVLVIVGPSLIVGLLVSMFQAATQINEQTLSFLPRFVVTIATIGIAGPWIITKFTDLFTRLFTSIPTLIGWFFGTQSMQELVVSEAQINQFIGQYLWPMIRISAFYFAVPIIGARTIPARIRIILTLFTALLVVPLLPNAPVISIMSLEGMMLIVKELLIGLALGFTLQIVMHVLVLTGQLVALKLGLGFAAQNDPSSGVSVTILSQFYLLLSTLLFLAINGHLAVINMMVNSFTTFPIGGPGLTPDDYMLIVHMFSWMFASALLISLPVFTSMMIVNVSFGVMGRSAPQLNILNVGFPITLMFGFILMWYSLSNFLPLFYQIIDEGLSVANVLVGSP